MVVLLKGLSFRQIIPLVLFVWIFSSLATLSHAQGTLYATLLPSGPGVPPLAGTATIYTPDTNGTGLLFPVLFLITINTNDTPINTGRIFGGSTAWAFDLGTPTVSGNTTTFSATSKMAAFQIDDMLAGRTELETLDEPDYSTDISGQVTAVPEPTDRSLILAGMAVVFLSRWCARCRTVTCNPCIPPA